MRALFPKRQRRVTVIYIVIIILNTIILIRWWYEWYIPGLTSGIGTSMQWYSTNQSIHSNIIHNSSSAKSLKILQIGLHKIGTTSLYNFFLSNNIPSIHLKIKQTDLDLLHSTIQNSPKLNYIHVSNSRIKTIDKLKRQPHYLHSYTLGYQFQYSFDKYLGYLAFNQTTNHVINTQKMFTNYIHPETNENSLTLQDCLDLGILETFFKETGQIQSILNNQLLFKHDFKLLSQPRMLEEFVYFGDFWLSPVTRPYYSLSDILIADGIKIGNIKKDLTFDVCNVLLNDSFIISNNSQYFYTFPRFDKQNGILVNHLNNIGWYEILDKQYGLTHNVKFILNIRNIFDYILSEIKQTHKAHGNYETRKFALNLTLDKFNRLKQMEYDIKQRCVSQYYYGSKLSNVNEFNDDSSRYRYGYNKQMSLYTFYDLIHGLAVQYYAWNCKVIEYCNWKRQEGNDQDGKCIVFDIKEDSIEKLANVFIDDLVKYGWIDNVVENINYTSWNNVANARNIQNPKWYFHYDNRMIQVYYHTLNVSRKHKLLYPNFKQSNSFDFVCPKWFSPNNGQFSHVFNMFDESSWVLLVDSVTT